MKRLLVFFISILLCLLAWRFSDQGTTPKTVQQDGGDFFYYRYGVGQPNCIVPLLRQP